MSLRRSLTLFLSKQTKSILFAVGPLIELPALAVVAQTPSSQRTRLAPRNAPV